MPINGVRGPGLVPTPNQTPTRPMFRGLAISASGLSAQRQRIEVIAQNIANAEVASSPDAPGYKRRTLMMETANQTNAMFAIKGSGSDSAGGEGAAGASAAYGLNRTDPTGDTRQSIEVPLLQQPPKNVPQELLGVAVSGIAEDAADKGRLVYEPSHPLANADGYVLKPDIDTTMEMANLADAKRLYEANASVFQVTKSMLRAALDI